MIFVFANLINSKDTRKSLICTAMLLAMLPTWSLANRQQEAAKTERWAPQPARVTFAQGIPSDALVLFDGSDMDAWQPGRASKEWYRKSGVLTVQPGSGNLVSQESFCDVQLHIEWRVPAKIKGQSGQLLGNSGIFLQQRYELQVLDSDRNSTYVNGQAGAIYKQAAPMVNASLEAEQWQSYDIVFLAPRFSEQGILQRPAYMTVFHNGVLIHHHQALFGPTAYIGQPPYQAHTCAPLSLQDHKDAVSYRNIWLRRL